MEKLKTLKKLTILSTILFCFLLINTDEVKAYQVTHTSADGSVTATANVPDNLPYYMVYEINTNQLMLMAAENPIKAGGEAGYPYTDGLINFYRQNSRYSWNSVYKSVNDSYAGSIVMFCHSEADCLTTFKRVDAQANHDIYYQDTDTLIIPKTLGIPDPSIEYEIIDGTEQGKKLVLYFKNYKSTDYAYIYNYQTGKKIKLENLEQTTTMTFDNISLDNTYQINTYNENNEIIKSKTIDIQQNLFISDERYIMIGGLNVKSINSYLASYFNTKETDKCFYKYKNEEEQNIDCNNESILIESPNKNTYVEHYIKDKNDNIIVRKNVNLNYLTNLPLFKFKSYFDEKNNIQVLEIITENLQETDIIYYSYDNENFYTLETKRINYLNFYNSSNVYLKLERNSEVIAEGYFDVVYNSYVNSSNNNNLQNTNFSFKNLLNNFKNIANNDFNLLKIGSNIYNQFKNSPLGLYFSIIITGSFIILIVKSLKR